MGPGSPLLPCAGGESCHPQLRVSLNPRHPSIPGAPASSCLCFPLKSQSPAGTAQIPWHLCADPTRPCPLNMEPPPSESPRRCLGHSSRPSELSMREGEAPLGGAGRGAVPCYPRGRPGGSHWSSCISLWMLARVCSQVRVAPAPERLILGPGVSATVDLTSPLLSFTPGCAFSLPGNLTSFSWLSLKPVPVPAGVCVCLHTCISILKPIPGSF